MVQRFLPYGEKEVLELEGVRLLPANQILLDLNEFFV